MSSPRTYLRLAAAILPACLALLWTSCVGVVPSGNLIVSLAGPGSGTVVSNPSGINCGVTCSINFPNGSTVTLTATASTGSTFVGWSGACTGSSTCQISVNQSASQTVVANFTGATGVQALKHIIFLV